MAIRTTPGPAPRSDPFGRARLDRILATLARLVLRLFFSRVEVSGEGHLPSAGPLLIVPPTSGEEPEAEPEPMVAPTDAGNEHPLDVVSEGPT